MDALYLIERDFGKLGLEGHAYREHTRAKIVDLLAFEYLNAVKILEIREDEHSVSDITEEIMREAELMRADYHREPALSRAEIEENTRRKLTFHLG
jgi:hypothetical protein